MGDTQTLTLPETALRTTEGTSPSAAALLPIMGVVFVAYLVIGLAVPALPLHADEGLGLNTFIVGLVAGSQFADRT